MQFFTTALFISTLCVSSADAGQAGLSPVTRVVQLMEGLTKKIEEEGKTEEDLYETYVCWAKTVIDTKTKTNAEAKSQIDELTAYISDINAGKIEFTDERGTLTKELADINAEIESAKAERDKEHSDFLMAEDEMKKAIAAMKKAVTVLEGATAAHKTGTFVQLSTGTDQGVAEGQGFAEREETGKLLAHAAELGERFLEKSDAMFLRRVLTGDVPDVDYKKVNRKASFKMKYKARSFKIQDLLKKLLTTFETNLSDATGKESDTQQEYNVLMTAKTDQKSKTESALTGMEAETGARGQAKEEAQTEVDELTKQIDADTKFIEETTKGLADKKLEWKDRQELRAGELAAISKSIGILRSDDARDLFSKSLSSQGLFLLQVKESTSGGLRAVEALRKASAASKDARLAVLASRLARAKTTGHFDAVVKSIDEMESTLKKEEESDKQIKEQCENDRMEDARKAVVTSRTVDERSEAIMKLEAEIADIKTEIEDKKNQIASIQKEVEEATKDRAAENAEFLQSTAEDEAAAKLVEMSKGVLENFYKDNGLAMLQKRMEPVVAGEAPPPPPNTFDAPYGGKTAESKGIVAMLGMIKEDIEKDAAKAKTEEEKAQADFEEFKTESETQVADLTSAIEGLEGSMGKKEEAVKDNKEDRKTLKGELDSVMEKMKDALPMCDFMTINYDMRMENRQVEISGLDEAKGVLKGAAAR